MKILKIRNLVSAGLFVGLALLAAEARAAESTCPAQPAWAASPSLPDLRKEPADLCAFNQYAWQSFLYLTQPIRPEGVLLFETFPTVSDLFPAQAPSDAACDNVDSDTGRRRIFLLRRSKSESPTTGQATSGGVLVDQAANVTYYEQYFNPVFSSFVHRCRLDLQTCQSSDEAANLRIPVGSFELKASWRPISRQDPNYGGFHTIKNVFVEDLQTGQCVRRDMALVGLHLTYAPAGHPEMVWATFEHVANAPDGPCTVEPTTPPAGYANWTYNDKSAKDCGKANIWPVPAAPNPPYPPTQAVRNWPYGNNPDQAQGQANIGFIKALNKSVAGFLPKSSVWKNYYLIGSVWTEKGALPAVQPSASDPGNVRGSALLANVTMETFTQSPRPLVSASKSCMTCHTTAAGSAERSFKVSHAFGSADAEKTCPTPNPITLPACQETQGTAQTAVSAAPALIPSH
jgi:hypothetical protein